MAGRMLLEEIYTFGWVALVKGREEISTHLVVVFLLIDPYQNTVKFAFLFLNYVIMVCLGSSDENDFRTDAE